jgi:hypothetical protein
MKKEEMQSRPVNVCNKYNSPMKRICVKKAAQFQSAVTGPKIYVYSHLDIIMDSRIFTMNYVFFKIFMIITRKVVM